MNGKNLEGVKMAEFWTFLILGGFLATQGLMFLVDK